MVAVRLASAVGLLILVASAGAVSCGSSVRTTTTLALTPCYVEGLSEQVRCGTLDVFEDRDGRHGRTIPVHVSVIPALVRDPRPDPLILLAGGPGQGARSYAALVPRFFTRVRRTRDIVLVDLRGTGDSAPLDCPSMSGGPALLAAVEDPARSAARCLQELHADVRMYTHGHALADLKDVVTALGYSRINLWGGSWGTRSALAFTAAYPELVRSAVLDGAVAMSLEFPYSYPVNASRALDRLLADCHAEEPCRAEFPDARGDIARWLDALERSPFRGRVRHPRTGEPIAVSIDRTAASEIVRTALYSASDAGRILLAIRLAAAGDYGPVAAMAERVSGWSVDTMSLGQTLSILCSEDVARVKPRDIDATLFGSGAVEHWMASCAAWPKGPSLTIDAETVLDAPALILSGDLDPVTPPARGEAMRRHFPNSVHVVLPGASHNVSFTGCIPRLIAEFIETASPQQIDPACASSITRPPYVTSPAGALP